MRKRTVEERKRAEKVIELQNKCSHSGKIKHIDFRGTDGILKDITYCGDCGKGAVKLGDS